ncbi:MAG TPA: hypothetical protein VK186_22775 [Candidatus Deferrimicrobium sp.]|nr:hypothetical protein [Candidatus Deferrimicrobium sp.]
MDLTIVPAPAQQKPSWAALNKYLQSWAAFYILIVAKNAKEFEDIEKTLIESFKKSRPAVRRAGSQKAPIKIGMDISFSVEYQ